MALPNTVPAVVLDGLNSHSQAAVARLLEHRAEPSDLTNLSHTRLAAVLVLLYEKDGRLRVLLTTRSKKLRTHAGQTALPGGRVDPTDVDYVATALREAHEEVALPLSSPHVHPLCLLRPFLSLNKLWVTPVVSLLSNTTVLDSLVASPDEVERIFTHPLNALLDPSLARDEPLVEIGSEDWPYDDELHSTSDSSVTWLGGCGYRMHRFRSSASPVKGLTADILIAVAHIAYDKPTVYDRYAPSQIVGFQDAFAALQAVEVTPVAVT